ncbi:dihydropteroate synthase [Jannaschia sp. M317]|uniref:dihydropteroate synthase n=1 Tax=Jannaschia sp. M317 TaxID=2867011 RepID=UPI0021A92CBB|nr:dihydropteroate synthase [Jannaschia sp. M317]UWQ17256.1 dihydropteroate synthase [Jannaschia sp. M317]
MTVWHRPLPAPDAPACARLLAGGWLRFTHVEVLERGRAPQVVPADTLDPVTLTRLSAARAAIAGLTWDVPRLMGILNVTPDSFSDGGRFDTPGAARAQVEAMQRADILDIGGESTRPGAVPVSAQDEMARILPVIGSLPDAVLSVDTRKAAVAARAVSAGAAMVNDVSAGTYDDAMLSTVADLGVPLCLMHAKGVPETMQDDPQYGDVLFDVLDALADRIAAAEAAGIPRDRLMVDPGIGFGKTLDHNLALLRRIGAFHDLGVPVLLGASRKRFIGTLGQEQQADRRMPGTLAVTLAAVAQGIQIHRVHDVAEVAQGLMLWRAVAA